MVTMSLNYLKNQPISWNNLHVLGRIGDENHPKDSIPMIDVVNETLFDFA